MKGNNELQLNSSTMMEAVQEWIDRRWSASAAPAPEVYRIRAESSHGVDTFVIGVKEPDDGDDQ